MAILERELKTQTESVGAVAARRRFSADDFQSIAATGIFGDQRVELIEGDIIEMAPIGYSHANVVDVLTELLHDVFGAGFRIRIQSSIALGGPKSSEPQPDIVVAVGSRKDFAKKAPQAKDIRLVIEIAESSLTYDRTTKAALYASAGIPEYWIVNLIDNCVEVSHEPAKGAYTATSIHNPGDTISPLNTTTAPIAVADILP